jgi:hypothetical protein
MPFVHKVFVSYHHHNDESYKRIFELRYHNRFGRVITRSVKDGDISPESSDDTIRARIRDEHLRDSSVTIVLVGTETWKRKHVDWEISSSLRDTELKPRSALLGILLPSYQRAFGKYSQFVTPPRLHFNIDCGYAPVYPWSENPNEVQSWIHEAYLRKDRIQPTNAFPLFRKNRPGQRWHPSEAKRRGGFLDWLFG